MELGNWIPREHDKIARELVLNDKVALHALEFAVSTPEFLRLVEHITRCGPIAYFSGRVYRMAPGTDHFANWHSDDLDNRLVGMSINLGPRPYLGGAFRLRRKNSNQMLCELPNTIPGSAILFRISDELEHVVSPLGGSEPKTAFAGWFKSSGDDPFSCFVDNPRSLKCLFP